MKTLMQPRRQNTGIPCPRPATQRLRYTVAAFGRWLATNGYTNPTNAAISAPASNRPGTLQQNGGYPGDRFVWLPAGHTVASGPRSLRTAWLPVTKTGLTRLPEPSK